MGRHVRFWTWGKQTSTIEDGGRVSNDGESTVFRSADFL